MCRVIFARHAYVHPVLLRGRACGRHSGCGGARTPAPTAADAKAFLGTVNDTMQRLGVEQSQSGWVQQNFITDDTEALAARVNQRYIDAVARFAKDATKYDKVEVAADQRRQLNLLKLSLVMATPSDPKEAEELTTIMARLEAPVRQGQMVHQPGKARHLLEHRRHHQGDGDDARRKAAA